jgi:hypothetical protein
VSVISFPRRADTLRPPTRPARPASHRDTAPRHRVAARRWRGTSSSRKAATIVVVALALSLAGSMFEANRQIEIHNLQSQLLQEQSTYAVQAGSLTNLSAPSQIATQAGALHLVDPTSVTQVPSTSLDAPLPLPRFSGYAPATSRTIR